MIGLFFKQYQVWFWSYLALLSLFLGTFWLYRLDLSYFAMASAFGLFFLGLLLFWQYLSFRRQWLTLQHFLKEDSSALFQKPLEQGFLQVLDRAEREAQSQIEVYKSRDSQLRQVVKMWSHQLKVPLAALSLMVQTDQLTMEDTQRQVLSLENTLANLLNYLKFQDKARDFVFRPCQVRPLVSQVLKKYRLQCLHKGIAIQLEGDYELVSDQKWLTFILEQVLDNAIKYNKPNGQIRIRLADGISIEDRGIGILPEDIPRLFEEGFTGFNGREHQKATGFGLYMTKQVADALNLTVQVTSQLDKGTTVHIFPKERSPHEN